MKAIMLGGLLALPGLLPAQTREHAHAHGEVPAHVQAKLDEAKARVAQPRWSAIRETRVGARRKSGQGGTLVELESAVNMAVVVVLDENGQPHTECIEAAPPEATR